ncbi:helix-turn-helix transcriptional regulator [Pedobacter psychrodurus]|uniref:helix-turn-helix domain-containing protein n=1 Tax=Pedobacter psychrodurus TaxID=2530456 RepID=UPI00292FB7ED|nr:helix-turn-helix transcriptional regulator [Pedobacter psychrodurus]
MEKIKRLQSVTQFNQERGQETLHPLVTVLDQSKSGNITATRFLSELYIVFLKEEKCADMLYGRGHYDYQNETLIFIAPNQMAGFDEPDATIRPNGWALAFHPDFIRGTALARAMRDYHFFSYGSSEALHVSEREQKILLECFEKIRFELEHAIDKHSKKLVISNIEMLLNYCERYYDRQFTTREEVNRDILTKFEESIHNYFDSGTAARLGLPTVAYFADEFHLSPGYFGDLIKRETGISPQEYIQNKLIDLAKEHFFADDRSISEIAYELGFKYPQHLTRLFKQKVGSTPNEYRSMN